MNIVFMGTPEFSVPPLEFLIQENYSVVGVVTQPDRPKGRGKKESISPVKEVAIAHNIPVLQPTKIKGNDDFFKELQALKPDLIVVVAFGQILPKEVLELPPLGCVNIHGSLLPKYRGSAPIQYVILNREATTGVTIMYMNEGIDTGDMLLKKEIAIAPKETYQTLHDKMAAVGALALKEAMPLIKAGGVERVKQEETENTYVGMISKEMGHIKWEESAENIDALIRAFNPWPTAYAFYQDVPMKIWEAEVVEEQSESLPGTILKVDAKGILVQTGKNQIRITQIQVPNKKRMQVSEYIKGNSIEMGLQFK